MAIEFKIVESEKIKDLFVIEPTINEDIRGNIWTSFTKGEIESLLPQNISFNHDKFSESKKNVLRGIHGDNKSWKLVTCIFGTIDQVIVDCRQDSPTFNEWEKYEISSDRRLLVLLPPGMGNAYYVKSETALYHYKLAYRGSYFDADRQFSLKWNDPKINIDWPTNSPLLSGRDS